MIERQWNLGKCKIRTFASFADNSRPPTWLIGSIFGSIGLCALSEEFLLCNETSEQARSSVGGVVFWSVEFEFAVFSLPLLVVSVVRKQVIRKFGVSIAAADKQKQMKSTNGPFQHIPFHFFWTERR